ncbi:MAG: hypothetical protein R3B93_19840 [Bacteroidia bacterium]
MANTSTVEDHTIIRFFFQENLPEPFDQFLAPSLLKDGKVFTYRHQDDMLDVWVVFYQAIHINKRLPRRLKKTHILKLGEQIGLFHQTCANILLSIPPSSKTLRSDVKELLHVLDTEEGQFEFHGQINQIKDQCELFLENITKLGYDSFLKIPVFVDWNIGNFSIDQDDNFYSRWDYDWFRMDSRILDFYFFSRVVSDAGDKTVFSYLIDTFKEKRFLMFLKEYHKIYPLSENEVRFLKEAYRFFILNYVVKYGNHFFHSFYAQKLQKEAFDLYLPVLDRDFDPGVILKELNI